MLGIVRRNVADLPSLLRLALRHIYEPGKMSLSETKLMEQSVVAWSRKTSITEVEKESIERIGWMLAKNEEGLFDQRKELFKEKGIDWRKFHRLPEAYTPRDFILGQQALQKWNEENPDLAG